MASGEECLNQETLERLAMDDLPEPEAGPAMAHVESCASCRADLEERRENESALHNFKKFISPDSNRSCATHSPLGGSSRGGDSASDRSFQDSIPGFLIQREIKRGGQGVVYEAVQQSTRRNVAIKVMREGPFAGAADRARFDREVHVLGRIKHPNIVTIHDSGEASGSFYFVMDYIDGEPFDLWVDRTLENIDVEPNPQARLQAVLHLFARICDAVHAAHLHGVIHRDLKPGNIAIDGGDEPHVLDFGLAKVPADDSDAGGEPRGMTMTGQFVGSLPWASPEQAQGIPGRIDVRTDVYSLGVMLYQVLTGKFPYPVTGGVHDVLSHIINTEPKRPGAVDRIGPRKAIRIDNDLDTIVLKAIAKDPLVRYQTAGELGRDILHYLRGEPIDAKRDSLGYVLRKQLRKHKFRAATAALFLVVIVAGLISSLVLWRSAERERKTAEAERASALVARDRAVAETAKASAVSTFVQNMLRAASPERALGNRDVTVRETLDAAAAELDGGSLRDQPEVEASVRRVLGLTYRGLAEQAAAEKQLRRSLEIQRSLGEAPTTALEDALNNLAMVLQDREAFEEAEALFREAVDVCRRIYPQDHPYLLNTMNNLALLLAMTNQTKEAAALYDQALAARSSPEQRETDAYAQTLNNRAGLEFEIGDPDRALSMLRQGLDIRRRILPKAHPDLAESMNNVAYALYQMKHYAESEAMFREALALDIEVYGDEHPSTAIGLNNLAMLLADMGRKDEAEAANRKALAIRRKTLPPGHEELLSSLGNLGGLLFDMGKYEESEALLREFLASPNVMEREGVEIIGEVRIKLMNVLLAEKRFDDAEKELLEVQRWTETDPRFTASNRLFVLNTVIEFYQEADQPEKAAAWIERRKAVGGSQPEDQTQSEFHDLPDTQPSS